MKKEIIGILIGSILLAGCQSSKPEVNPADLIPYIHLGASPTTSITPTSSPSLSPTPSPTSSPSADTSASDEKELYKVMNISGCSLTDSADFSLDKDYLVTKLYTWYTWQTNETEVPYDVLSSGKVLASGKLTRDACDPYQTQWCGAIDKSFNKNLSKGDYTLKLSSDRICQNSGSNGKGFIIVSGK